MSRCSRVTRFPLGALTLAQVTLILKIKRWTAWLRKDVEVCQIMFSDDDDNDDDDDDDDDDAGVSDHV